MEINLHKIRDLLTKNKMSLTALSKELGITRAALYSIIERNSTTIETLLKICQVFEVSPMYFMDGDNIDSTVDVNKNRQSDANVESLRKIISLQDEIIQQLKKEKSEHDQGDHVHFSNGQYQIKFNQEDDKNNPIKLTHHLPKNKHKD